jgi:hypothetical protein
MGDSQAFLNMKYSTRRPILVDDKGGIIFNKIELQKVSNYVHLPLQPFLSTSLA